jgi:hypothetical protein
MKISAEKRAAVSASPQGKVVREDGRRSAEQRSQVSELSMNDFSIHARRVHAPGGVL